MGLRRHGEPRGHPLDVPLGLQFPRRAREVETETGMGLIDRQGNWIIPPVYEIIDYDPVESNVFVRKEGLWAEFDYLGRQQSEFGEREART